MVTALVVDLIPGIARLLGLLLLAAAVGFIAAATFRWLGRISISRGLAVLLAVAAIGIVLNTTTILATVISGQADPFTPETALVNVVTFGLGAIAALGGRKVGDRFVGHLSKGTRHLSRDLGEFVTGVGRTTRITIPDEIEDMEYYDPITPAQKETIVGRTFTLPRGLTIEEVESRIADRLKKDYGIGHAAVSVEADGTVTRLAAGSRPAGLGATIPPGRVAVVFRADPPFSAAPGDIVQIWQPGEPQTRVATGELRAVVEDIVTVVVDEEATESFDPSLQYRLITVPGAPRYDREFAGLLRVAHETATAVTIEAGSPLSKLTVGGLNLPVLAIKQPDGTTVPLPHGSRKITPGETISVLGKPGSLTVLEQAGTAIGFDTFEYPIAGEEEPTR